MKAAAVGMESQMSIGRHVVAIQLAGEWQGQGVVVADEYVLTAAHCLPSPEASCFLADDVVVNVRRPDGKAGRMKAAFIDAVGDLAALAPIDDDPFVLDGVEPICVSLEWSCSALFEDRPASKGRFFAHDAGEVEMTWKEIANGSAMLMPSRRIIGGTSGGPIVDASDRLIGILTNSMHSGPSGNPDDPNDVGDESSSFLLLGAGLPPWLSTRIVAAQTE